MKPSDLLAGFLAAETDFDTAGELSVTGITLDSRAVQAGNVFIALAGSKQHGLSHAEQAIAQGASVLVYDPAGGGAEYAAQLVTDIPLLAIDNLARVLGDIAARFYGEPSRSMDVIGITGTNGKTSCSQFLSQVLDDCGIIGTLGWGDWGNLNKTLNTTPDALAVQRILANLLAADKKTVAMEVSSHGLDQGRVNGVHFKGAVFTNISRDHLDYHGSMENYLQAKLALLHTPDLAFVVVNLDDAYSKQILAAVPDTVQVWGVTHTNASAQVDEHITVDNIHNTSTGIEFDVRWRGEVHPVSIPLYGDFNVENVLCVLAVMLALGVSLADATKKLAHLQSVTGRMERFGGDAQPMIFVDYAHTPDALDKVLGSVKKHCAQDLWVVFGCGGNRDKAKRPIMAGIAASKSNKLIITSDNPRSENPDDIIADMEQGVEPQHYKRTIAISDRKQAIKTACQLANANDIILIAGKGHETYQEIKGVRYDFDDMKIVKELLEQLNK